MFLHCRRHFRRCCQRITNCFCTWCKRWPSANDINTVLDPKRASETRNLSVQLAHKNHPTPRHRTQVALRSAPMPLQDGHSFQSESLIALEFVPLHRSPLIVFPQRRFMRVALNPALPHSVQEVTGTGRFRAMNAPSRTITRKPPDAAATSSH
jgi:hypothetical protein